MERRGIHMGQLGCGVEREDISLHLEESPCIFWVRHRARQLLIARVRQGWIVSEAYGTACLARIPPLARESCRRDR